MKLHSNTRRVLFEELKQECYGLKMISQDSIPNMIDIGANVGMLSIMARLLHPHMNIFAFEPHEETFKDLKENVDNLRIKTYRYAFGNGDVFYLTKERKMDLCNSFSTEKNIINKTQEIQSLDLEQIFKMVSVEPEDTFLKIDCEGAETFMVDCPKSIELLKRTKLVAMEAHEKDAVIKLKPFIEWFMKTMWGTHTVIIDKQTSVVAKLLAVEKSYYRSQLSI